MSVPNYLWVYAVSVLGVLTPLLIIGARAALKLANYPKAETQSSARWIRNAVLAWVAFSVLLGVAGEISPALMLPGLRLAAGGAVAIVFGIALFHTPKGARILHAVPQSWLIGLQAYRVGGFIFLLLYGIGVAPGAFALPAGFGDVIIGLTALPLAGLYASGATPREKLAWLWNLAGLFDLVVAVTMGLLTSPALHAIPGQPLNFVLANWPLDIVPLFAVPLAALLHIASLVKLSWDHEIALQEQPA